MAARATGSKLQDAVIQVLDASGDPVSGAEIPVAFKPTDYSLNRSVTYGSQSLPGNRTPVTQFVSGEADTLTMELFFDTFETGTDVREQTDRIDDLLAVDAELHAPPICRFVWGSLNFRSVVESANKSFTMFLDDGTPVRARVDVTFREYAPPGDEQAARPRQSADRTKRWRVTEGDTLWSIAASEYGDPTKWRVVATANGIENPRTLAIGAELTLPPLESP
jgi:hypothetical protein